MAYTKTTWATGDTITAEKLNHIEDGIAAAGMLILEASSGENLGKTFNEMAAILDAGTFVLLKFTYTEYNETSYLPLTILGHDQRGDCMAVFGIDTDSMIYTAIDADTTLALG